MLVNRQEVLVETQLLQENRTGYIKLSDNEPPVEVANLTSHNIQFRRDSVWINGQKIFALKEIFLSPVSKMTFTLSEGTVHVNIKIKETLQVVSRVLSSCC